MNYSDNTTKDTKATVERWRDGSATATAESSNTQDTKQPNPSLITRPEQIHLKSPSDQIHWDTQSANTLGGTTAIPLTEVTGDGPSMYYIPQSQPEGRARRDTRDDDYFGMSECTFTTLVVVGTGLYVAGKAAKKAAKAVGSILVWCPVAACCCLDECLGCDYCAKLDPFA